MCATNWEIHISEGDKSMEMVVFLDHIAYNVCVAYVILEVGNAMGFKSSHVVYPASKPAR